MEEMSKVDLAPAGRAGSSSDNQRDCTQSVRRGFESLAQLVERVAPPSIHWRQHHRHTSASPTASRCHAKT